MTITSDQIEQIIAGTHVYVECELCGQGEVIPVDPYEKYQGSWCEDCKTYTCETDYCQVDGYGCREGITL